MIAKTLAVVCCVLALAMPVFAQTPQQTPVDQAFALYLAVASGKRTMQSLTPEQQKEVQLIATAMAVRPRYTSQKCEDLADAQQRAREAAEDLSACLANADGSDDCDSEAQDAQDAHDDYEQALSDADGDCQ